MGNALWIVWSNDQQVYFGQIINAPESAFTIGPEAQVRAFADAMTAGEDTFVAFCGSLQGCPVEAILNAPEVWFGEGVIWEPEEVGEVVEDALLDVGESILAVFV
jgi:hypothetical protein